MTAMIDIEGAAVRLLDALDHIVEIEADQAWDEAYDVADKGEYAGVAERVRRAEMAELLAPVHRAAADLIRDALGGDVSPHLWGELHRRSTCVQRRGATSSAISADCRSRC
jgi:hypothetical protein